MKKLISLSITILTLSCSNDNHSKKVNNDPVQNSAKVTSNSTIDVLNQNVAYVGFIETFDFSNENEVYIGLYLLQDEISEDEYLKIEKLADSLIYEDDENSRYKFPENVSRKYFDLRGLSKLSIYDNQNRFVSHAEFLRVEFFNQSISSSFIAVYKTDKKIKSGAMYGISNFTEATKPINYDIKEDTILTQKVLTKLKVAMPYYGLANNGKHIQYKNSDSTISIVNSDEFAYIVLSHAKEFKVLYKSPDLENITDVLVVPQMNHKLPYLLTRNVKPETDVMWDKLLYYDGTKYIDTKRQRIE